MVWCLGSHTLKLNFCQCVEGWSSSHARLLPLFYNDNITPQDTRICSFRKTHYVKTGFNELMVWEAQTLREVRQLTVFMGTAVELGQPDEPSLCAILISHDSVFMVSTWNKPELKHTHYTNYTHYPGDPLPTPVTYKPGRFSVSLLIYSDLWILFLQYDLLNIK